MPEWLEKKTLLSETNRNGWSLQSSILISLKNFGTTLYGEMNLNSMFGGQMAVWRKSRTELNKENILPTVKGGSVMVWGCCSSNGVGYLHIIDGIVDQYVYLKILKQNLHERPLLLSTGSQAHFTHRSAMAIHTHTLKTPPNSPDLSPIKHL